MDRKIFRLAKPTISEEDIGRVTDVLRSGNLVQGKWVEHFENNIQEFLGVHHAVAVSSGTAALHLAMVVMGIETGDEVIIPAFSFPATANVVELVGAKPIFVDIQLKDFCIATQKIEQKISNKTRAIMPVHEFGQMADMNSIIKIARENNLAIIEDAACALGAKYQGKKAGTLGDIGCVSFHPRKTITTGEGGILVTGNSELAMKLRKLRNHGIVKIDNRIDFEFAGFNYRLTDFQAALACDQVLEMDEFIKHNQQIARLYDERLKSHPDIETPQIDPDKYHSYQTYHILLKDNIDRNQLIRRLKQNGVETNYGANSIVSLSYYANKYNPDMSEFENAETAFNQGLALPIGNHLSLRDIEEVSEIILHTING